MERHRPSVICLFVGNFLLVGKTWHYDHDDNYGGLLKHVGKFLALQMRRK